jgi:predicted nucleic acid-binding protein
MTKYLLDSNIISEPSKPVPNMTVVNKLIRNSKECSITAVTYFEMLHGILILSEGKRKQRLVAYLQETVVPFYDFISYDLEAARVNAEIIAKLESVGNPLPIIDSQIASIALLNNWVLVTRNVKDFEPIQNFFSLKIENWFEK